MEAGGPLLISWRMQQGPSDGTQAAKPLSAGNAVRAEHQDGHVVALRTLFEGAQLGVDAARDVLGREAGAVIQQRADPLLAEALAAGARGIGDAVGVEHHRLPVAQNELVGVPFDVLEGTEQRARMARHSGAGPRPQHVGRRMARAYEADADAALGG